MLIRRLTRCVLVVFTVAAGPAAAQTPGDPDVLYAAREHLPSAQAAADIWDAHRRANPADFESAWKLARACYWLGGREPADQRRAEYERGIEAGRQAIAIHADRPEGHFWVAANMGAMAESFGVLTGLRYRGPVKSELETVLRLDPAFQQGSADRALGRWYFRVPGLFGGSDRKSVEHLLKSLTYDPDSAASHFFLADTYLDMHRPDEARRELQKVLEARQAPEWAPEVREFQEKARARLARLP
jgi:tetratricopeptide (TPR) repeat protein